MFTVNNVPFDPPSVPVLLQILSGNANVEDLVPSGSIYYAPNNTGRWPKSVEITMNNLLAFGPHPIHLHGVSSVVFLYSYDDSWYVRYSIISQSYAVLAARRTTLRIRLFGIR